MVGDAQLEGTWLLPYRRRVPWRQREHDALAVGLCVVSSLARPGRGSAAALLSWPVIATRAGTGHLCVCCAPLTSRASSVFCVLASCGAGLSRAKMAAMRFRVRYPRVLVLGCLSLG